MRWRGGEGSAAGIGQNGGVGAGRGRCRPEESGASLRRAVPTPVPGEGSGVGWGCLSARGPPLWEERPPGGRYWPAASGKLLLRRLRVAPAGPASPPVRGGVGASGCVPR